MSRASPGTLEEAPPGGGWPASPEVFSNPDMVAPVHAMTVEETVALDRGGSLPRVTVSFETYGTLSPRRDNAILVCHSLTHGAHAAGRHSRSAGRSGWWDAAIGPGKMLDTENYFVICSDALAAGASTGPASLDPATGRPYGLAFPAVTVRDMVGVQRQLLHDLGIDRVCAVIGGCLGGQQAIEWAICHPDSVASAIVITTTPATSAHTIAIFTAMRHLIRADPAWNGGDYYGGTFPRAGLGSAMAVAIPLWMSRGAMEARFGRRAAARRGGSPLDPEFEVETFIGQVAGRARSEIDPNSLMYLMRATEYFDLEGEYDSLERALAPVTARVLFVSYREDWRYPPPETERMHQALRQAGGQSWHVTLDSSLGHGAFLYDPAGLARVVGRFLATS